jgi:Flp pilus assembly protein TadD
VKLKDPTDWFEDLSVFVDDHEIALMAEQWEPEALYDGPKAPIGAWLAWIGCVGGAFGSLTLSPDIRGSAAGFIGFVIGAFILLKGVKPVTGKLLGPGICWLAVSTLFWTFILSFFASIGGLLNSAWLGYGLSGGIGLLIGLVHGGLNPNVIRRLDLWMLTSLFLGPASTLTATLIHRELWGGSGVAAVMALSGLITGAVFMIPTAALIAFCWDESHGLARMGTLYLHNDNFALKAVAYFDRAIGLSPNDPDLHNLRGIAYSKAGDPDRAATDWKRAANLNPHDAEPHLNLGVDCLRQGKLAEATAALERAREIAPRHPKVHSNLGVARERCGDLDRAIQHFSDAIALVPDYPNAYSNRAFAHFRKGDYANAVRDCDRSIELDGRFVMAYVNRGHALAALGDIAEAAQSYRLAMELEASPETREEATRGLDALNSRRKADVV